jgi:cobalt-zinc-cadmium efflux system membrane fusion protein
MHVMNQTPPPLAARALSRRQQLKIVLMIVFAAIVLVGAIWLAPRLARARSASGQEVAAPLPPGSFRATDAQLAGLKAAPVVQTAFRTVRTTEGKIALNGDATTPVYSPYSGRVARLIAGLGDTVKKGAPLLAIEASEFAQAQNDLVNAAAQLELARTTEKRKHAAFDAKGAALQDWEQAQAQLTAAAAAFAGVRNRLRILGKTDAEIDSIVRGGQFDPVTTVLAPIGGVVTDRQVGPGQYVQAGASNPVYTVGDLSSVWLIANVREVDAPLIRRGQSIEVHVLALPDTVFRTQLSYVGSSIDPATRRIPVRAVIENPDGALKPEMFATFDIITGAAAHALAVPEAAVVYEDDTARVWVVQPGNVMTLRQVRTGRSANGLIEVTAGLHLGEQVVTSGSLFIDRAARSE